MIPYIRFIRDANGGIQSVEYTFFWVSNDPAQIAAFFFWMATVF